MKISQAASLSGVPAKTIRYYESIGLLPRAARHDNGYRSYGNADVETLRFISRARALGFTVKDVGNLLALWRDRGRASADVKKLARDHIEEIEERIAQLDSMRRTLLDLVERCHGDHRPDCPILEDLAGAMARNEAEEGCH